MVQKEGFSWHHEVKKALLNMATCYRTSILTLAVRSQLITK
jgi:hypothetical protein